VTPSCAIEPSGVASHAVPGALLVTLALAAEGVQVTVASAFGTEQLPTGLRVVIGRRAA
jgi:hypothetical protein